MIAADASRVITSSPSAWRIVKIDGHSFIYSETGTLICMVPKQDKASADCIARACRHHDELMRLVKAAVNILSDGSEENVALGLGISPCWAEEFCRQATEILHRTGLQA